MPGRVGPAGALALLVLAFGARAADAPSPPKASARAAAAASTPQPHGERAKGKPAASAAPARLSDAQLRVADRVLTGDAECDHQQRVQVEPLPGQPGHFRLRFGRGSYTMVPEETTSGAVRLEDKKAGMVWLQIPTKSMLMNARAGQRVADGCLHAEQRAAIAAAQGAAAAAAAASKP